MNSLTAITIGVGLQDGLNPCIFIACAVFILLGGWVKPGSSRIFFLRLVFGFVYAFGVFNFNFGPAQVFVFQGLFIFIAKVLYFVLGAGALFLGILTLKDWFLLGRKLPAVDQARYVSGWVLFPLTVILGLVLSALSTLWPINTYLMLLGNEAILREQWHIVIKVVTGYVLASLWPLWLVWALVSVKDFRPSLLKILSAVVFITASTAMIFIFK